MKKSVILLISIPVILVIGAFVFFLISLIPYKQKVVEDSSNGAGGYPVVSEDSSYNVNTVEGSKVKKYGNINILVKNLDLAYAEMEEVNSEYSAEVTSMFDNGKGNDRYIQATIKIPVAQFDAYYEKIKGLEGEVVYANINSTDVSEEYIDITSRLTNLKNVEAQLAEILKSAKTVEDILAVQKELSSTRGEIERYEQQKRYFDGQADYAHLSIQFSLDKEGLNIADEEWKPFGEVKVALNSLVAVLKGLVNIAIWILVFSPIVLIPAGVVWFVNKKKNTMAEK